MTFNKKQKVLFCFLLFSVCFALFTACENPFIEKKTQKAQEANGGGGDNVITIGGNGNWYVNGVDTGIRAQGGTTQPGFLGGVAGITGTYRIGETLSVITTGIIGAEAPFTYQWIADGVAISGAFSQTYTLHGADAGKTIGCVVSHEAAHGSIVAWGRKTPFTIDLETRGNKVASDIVTLSGETGQVEDVITLTYNITDTALHNNLEFRNIDPVLAPATAAGAGTRQYTVKAADAINGVIAIIAVFTHYNNAHLDPIAFTIPGNITVTYGDNDNSYTNTIKNTYSGTGTIRYSSNNTAIASVDSSGVVTIRKAGNVIISAEKDADEDYAYAFQSYNLIINPKPVTITGLGAADKVYDGNARATVTGTPLIVGILADDDLSLNHGTAAFEDSNAGNGKTVYYYDWSLIGRDAENYTLTAQPESVYANIAKAAGAAVSGPPIVKGTPTMVSVAIHNVSNAGTSGQTVEYAISTSNSSVPQTGWQTTLIISGLTPNTTYYVFARTQENTNYFAGTAQVSTGIRTASSPYLLSIGDPSPLVYTNPANKLTPIETNAYTEREASFSVTVSGFKSDADADNARLTITGNGLTFSGYDTVGYATGGAKTFTVTVTIDDTVTINADSVSIAITCITGILEGYETGSEKTISIARTDGRTTERAIPLTRSNIAAFNVYATAETTRTVALTLNYKLTENITANNLRTDMGPDNNWTAVGTYINNTSINNNPLTGSFDGQGYTITGIKITSSDGNQGLFSYVGIEGIVKNTGLVNCNVSGGTVGGVTGVNNGTVQNCYATGDVSGGSVGGVVGLNNGTVQNCYATGNVSGNIGVGGVVGFNDGTVQNCYAAGNVSGDYYIGGIAGYNQVCVQNCYVTGNVSGINYVCGLVGWNDILFIVNCVALNGSIKARDYDPLSDIRSFPSKLCIDAITVLIQNINTISIIINNHTRSDMILQYNQDGNTVTTLSGWDISAAQYNNADWWATAGNWSTGDQGFGWYSSEWDFTNVWEWNSTTNLPILRNMPTGAQNHTVQ